MKGAVIVVDLAAKIRVINRAAAHMLGYKEEELLGHHLCTDVCGQRASRVRDAFDLPKGHLHGRRRDERPEALNSSHKRA